MKKQGRALIVVLLTIFVDLLGFGIVIPIIPLLLANPASPDYILAKNTNFTEGYIFLGAIVAIFSFMQFLAAPILGQLSDKYGRKKLLAFSLAGSALGYLLFALGIILKNIPLLFLSRALDGVTGGSVSVAQAAVADITNPAQRARNFGLIGAASGLGFILGPFLGGKLSDPTLVSWFNAATPFYFAALLSLINVISVLFFFRETLIHKRRRVKIKWARAFLNIFLAASLKHLRRLYWATFLFQAGFAFYTTFFSIFLIIQFNFTQGEIGNFFSYVGVWIALTQAVIIRFLTRHFPEDIILKISLLASGLAILLFFIPTGWVELLLVTPIFAIFTGLTQATMPGLISKLTPVSRQGEALGISTSLQALAQALSPVLSAYIATILIPQAPIAISAFIIILAALVLIIPFFPSLKIRFR